MKNLEEFERNLGYKFKQSELLEEALTHKSTKQALNNERLEFLGDAVMDLLVAEYLFKKFSKIAEGDMSKLRAALVNEKSFANMSRRLKMGEFLRLSQAEENNGGREKDSILSDAFEAVMGAIYLEAGLDKVREISITLLELCYPQIDFAHLEKDYKTALQEVTQATLGVIPTYAANLPERTNLIKSTLSIIFINILIGIMMGLVVFTFIFAYGADSTASGPGLIFISLVTLFAKLGIVGNVMAVAFFVSLLFAGITSAVSMIEPFAYYLVRKFEISRKMALLYIGAFVYILGIFCILSYYSETSSAFSVCGKPFFDALDFLTSNIMMPIGAIVFSFFVGYKLKKESLYLLFGDFMGRAFFEIWYFFLRYVVPVAICAIMIYQMAGK